VYIFENEEDGLSTLLASNDTAEKKAHTEYRTLGS
jgi:hypothetical protein